VSQDGLSYREGTAADLQQTFALSEQTIYDSAASQGIVAPGRGPTDAEIRSRWLKQRPLVEFIASRPGGSFWIAENDSGPVGYARVVRFGSVEELTELMVRPDHQGVGIGRELLERCWPGDPSRDLERLVIANGTGRDLTLYTDFGTMPVAGHWNMRLRTELYVERRSKETIDAGDFAVHVLTPERAMREWKRLEPPAIGHEREPLHEFMCRDRTCLATMARDGEHAAGLCWVSAEAEIGPAVGATPEDLVPVVLVALDRVARAQEPEYLTIFCTTLSWWLMQRLRKLGFQVWWPSWVMCSVPLPGLDRYVPTRPPHVL
jgi:GNAT superfamily N-acetyltransferase